MDKTSSNSYSYILKYTIISTHFDFLLVRTHSNMNHDFKKTDTKESDKVLFIIYYQWNGE